MYYFEKNKQTNKNNNNNNNNNKKKKEKKTSVYHRGKFEENKDSCDVGLLASQRVSYSTSGYLAVIVYHWLFKLQWPWLN